MKKLIFAGFAVLLALALVTCDMMPVPLNGEDEYVFTNVVYSPDGSLTLYLEGGVMESKTSRALSSELAQRGHDFYEVVFFDGASFVARASWERGESAGIRNVRRDINYNGTTTANAQAILFVGTRDDRTLLAVGLLTDSDGGNDPGFNAGTHTDFTDADEHGLTYISSTTTYVTFSIASLNGGAELVDPDDIVSPAQTTNPGTVSATTSTFLTSDDDLFPVDNDTTTNPGNTIYSGVQRETTNIGIVTLNEQQFPIYKLDKDKEIAATYTINFVNSIGTILTTTTSDYLAGIKLRDTRTASTIDRHNARIFRARFPSGGLNYYISPEVTGDMDLTATYRNTYAATASGSTFTAVGPNFNNVIEFLIKTPNLDGVFSLGFEIPVFAITQINTPVGVDRSVNWVIRPGYGIESLNLDNGRRGSGGQILLGVGNLTFNTITVGNTPVPVTP